MIRHVPNAPEWTFQCPVVSLLFGQLVNGRNLLVFSPRQLCIFRIGLPGCGHLGDFSACLLASALAS